MPEAKKRNYHDQTRANEQITKLESQLAELTDLLKRSQADFVNYRRRKEEEQADFVNYASAQALSEILIVFDNFKLASGKLPENLKGDEWVEGVLKIEKHFEDTLSKLGIQKIPTQGVPYSPELHEALLRGPGKQDEIIAELAPGYKLHERVLRPAKVQVGDGTVK